MTATFVPLGRRPPDPPPRPEPSPRPEPPRETPSETPSTPPAVDAEVRLFRSAHGSHLFVADGSRIYDLADTSEPGPGHDHKHVSEYLPGLDLWDDAGLRRIDGQPLAPPPLRSISLNVMQACNMSCGYCYADEGRFGGSAQAMGSHVAFAAVDRLLADSPAGADVVVGFMGGEPLLARDLVHDVVAYADRAAVRAGKRARFSLTTNLTTVTPADARLFAKHPFTVSVSIDGDRDGNDAVRRMNSGASAYEALRAGLDVLDRHGRPNQLAARVTVTPRTAALRDVLEHVIGLGFDEVGFAAVVASPDPALEFTEPLFAAFLHRMVECGEVALRELAAGRRYPFGNLETALQQIHRGSHRPYPCGAGASYLSASATGDLFACHRLVGDSAFAMGSVTDGPDHDARARHLAVSHVDRMQPCRSCWARYLCGGGCYHEVHRRGRTGCDYIRGWLEFCLRAYVELAEARPEYFQRPKYFQRPEYFQHQLPSVPHGAGVGSAPIWTSR